MTLQIRDQRARELAQRLASIRHVTMTEAVIQALESELQRERQRIPLEERLAAIADELAAVAGPDRRTMSKEEIDALWGQ